MKRLLLRITDACSSRCRHCLHECGPDKKSVMSPGAISRCIREAHPEEYVIVTGGEAALYPALVLHALREAATLGIPSWLNTNGFWGREPGAAADFARALKREGLAVACFSVDGLHQEYIPFNHVLCALRACRDAGIPRVEATVTYVDSAQSGIGVDEITRELEAKLRTEPGIKVVVHDRISFLGRACSALAPYAQPLPVERALAPSGYCSIEDETGVPKDFCAGSFFLVNPNGTVDICNVSFPGSLAEKPLAEIVSDEVLRSHPLLSVLQSEGVPGLYRLACEHGFAPHARYVSRCHLCQSALQWFKTDFPEVVGNW